MCIFTDHTALERLCQHLHIPRLTLSGSILKHTIQYNNDIHLLTEFETHVPGRMGMVAIKRESAELLGDRRVDLRTAEDLSPNLRDALLRMAAM